MSSADLTAADPSVQRGERVKGPYVAETYPVHLDDALVMIDIPD